MIGHDLPDPQIARKFAAIRRRQTVLVSLAAAFGLAVLVVRVAAIQVDTLTGLSGLDGWLTLALLVFLVGVVILIAVNWRCPACGTPLGRSPTFCRNCGIRLQA